MKLKKIVYFIFIVILCAGMAGCSNIKEIEHSIKDKDFATAKEQISKIKDAAQKNKLVKEYELGLFADISYLLNTKDFVSADKRTQLLIDGTAKKITQIVAVNYFMATVNEICSEWQDVISNCNIEMSTAQLTGESEYLEKSLSKDVEDIQKTLGSLSSNLPKDIFPNECQKIYGDLMQILNDMCATMLKIPDAFSKKNTKECQSLGNQLNEMGQTLAELNIDAEFNRWQHLFDYSDVPYEYKEYITVV